MVEPIDITRLQQRVEKHPNVAAAGSVLGKVNVLSVAGLQGSSRALFSVGLFRKLPRTYLYLLNDAEAAGYFYHDVTQVMGSSHVLFFPSAYKRAAKYGQLDAANQVLRTEVLTRLQDGDAPLLIISSPDAVIEKTVSGEHLKENTLKLSVGEQVDPTFVSEVLDSYGFQYVDYVYEPGQYAVRGSILDVFSFAGEHPYRIDFFGDEIETIRAFDLESQLSKEKLQEIRIVPELNRSGHQSASLFNSLPHSAVIGIEDARWIHGRVESLNEEELHIDPKDTEFVKAELLTLDEFKEGMKPFKQVRLDRKSTRLNSSH